RKHARRSFQPQLAFLLPGVGRDRPMHEEWTRRRTIDLVWRLHHQINRRERTRLRLGARLPALEANGAHGRRLLLDVALLELARVALAQSLQAATHAEGAREQLL